MVDANLEIILPEQFFDCWKFGRPVREVALMLAVFERALIDIDLLASRKPLPSGKGLKLMRNVLDWVDHDQPQNPFSLGAICARVGMDEDAVRAVLCAKLVVIRARAELESKRRRRSTVRVLDRGNVGE